MILKFNVFGRIMSVYREADNWVLYRESDAGVRTKVYDVVIPSDLTETELAQYLDDIYHEYANQKYHSVFQIN
ncbi:DUF7661 family protein [Vibrio parahaemolyticus]